MAFIDRYRQSGKEFFTNEVLKNWQEPITLMDALLVLSLRSKDTNTEVILNGLLKVANGPGLPIEVNCLSLIKFFEELTEAAIQGIFDEKGLSNLFYDGAKGLMGLKEGINETILMYLSELYESCLDMLLKNVKQPMSLLVITRGGSMNQEVLKGKYAILELKEAELELLWNHRKSSMTDIFNLLLKLCGIIEKGKLADSDPLTTVTFNILLLALQHKVEDTKFLAPIENNFIKFKNIFSGQQLEQLASAYSELTQRLKMPTKPEIFATDLKEYMKLELRAIKRKIQNTYIEATDLAFQLKTILNEDQEREQLFVQCLEEEMKADPKHKLWKILRSVAKNFHILENSPLFPMEHLRATQEHLTQTAEEAVSLNSPTETTADYLNSKYDLLLELAQKQCPSAALKVYGSWAADLWVQGFDLDLTIIESSIQDTKEFLSYMAASLPEEVKIKEIFTKNRSLLRLNFGDSPSSFNLSVNNLMSFQMTELLKTYFALDARARKLVKFVKIWAKSQQILDGVRGYFTGFHLTLLVLSYLQRESPPILPLLQIGYHEPELVQNVDIWHDRNSGFKSSSSLSVGALIYGFFNEYATNCEKKKVLNVKTGECVDVTERNGTLPVLHPLTGEVVGASILYDSSKSGTIGAALYRAIHILKSDCDLTQILAEPF